MLFENDELKQQDPLLGDAKQLYGVLTEEPLDPYKSTWKAADQEIIANAQASIMTLLQEEKEGTVAGRYDLNKDIVQTPEGYGMLLEEIKGRMHGDYAEAMDSEIEGALIRGDGAEAQRVYQQQSKLKESLDTAYPKEDELAAAGMLSDHSTSIQGRQLEVDMQIVTKLQDVLGDRSLASKAIDITGLLILSDTGLDWRDMMDELEMSEVDPEEFVRRWHDMPVEHKEALLPVIFEKLPEAFEDLGIPNSYKQAMALVSLLDPSSVSDVERDVLIDDIFLGVDVAVVLGGIYAALKTMRAAAAGLNTVKISKHAGRQQTAERANTAAVMSDEIAKSMNTSQEIAHTSAMPSDAAEVFVEVTGGVDRGTQRLLSAQDLVKTPIGQRMAQLRDPNFAFREGILDAKERAAAITRFDEAFKAKQDAYLNQGIMRIGDVKRTHVDDEGFVFEFNVYDQKTGKLITKSKEKIYYTTNDVGSFEGTMQAGMVERGTASPLHILRSVSDGEEVESATRVIMAQERYRVAFNNMLDTALKPLGKGITPSSRKKLKELDDVLLRGDDFVNTDGSIGKVFTIDELRAGIRNTDDSIIYLDNKQIKAYYDINEMSKYYWMLRNEELRKTLKINGFKNARINGQDTVAHVYEAQEDAAKAVRSMTVRKAWDENINKLVDLDVEGQNVLENIYTSDQVLVRTQKPYRLPDGSYVDYVVTNKGKISDVPPQVLHYKPGYVPRVYEDGLYFVKAEVKGTRNGVPNKLLHEKTERVFRRKSDAEAWVKAQKERDPNVTLHVRHDREMSIADLDDEAIGFSGGLYTGSRASSPLVFETAGEAMPRVGALESMMRNAQALSNYLPRNQWRIGMQKRWLNTAKKLKAIDENEVDFFNAPLKLPKGSKEYNALEAARDYLKDQMSIPSISEEYFHTKLRELAVKIESGKWLPGAEKVRYGINKLSTQDPFAHGRSLAFNTLLGWYNPVQFFVQAQGASIAWSLKPTSLAKASFRKGLALRVLSGKHKIGTFVDDATKAKDVQLWSKMVGMDADELAEMSQAWNKSGLFESITATADHAAAAQNFGFGAKAIRDQAAKGLVFYREGELFTRTTAFTTAWDEMRKIKGIKKGKLNLTPDEEKKLFDLAMGYQMNLTKANKAAWQKGVFSIPTQFLQIQAKWLEEIWPKALGGKSPLTPTQKLKFMGMQMGIYGAAGVPFADVLIDSITQMADIKPEDVDPVAQRYMAGGILEAMVYGTLGADIEFGSRGAILSNLDDAIRDMIYGTPDSMWKHMFGAFGGVTNRAVNALAHLKPLTQLTWEGEWTVDDLKYAANEVGSIVSTWNNAQKAWFMYSQRAAFSSNGSMIADELTAPDMFNLSTIIAQGIGFQPKAIPDTYDLASLNRFKEDQLKARVDALMHFHHKYLSNREDPEIAMDNMSKIQAYLLHDLNDYDKFTVLERVGKRIAEPRTRMERELRKYYRNTTEAGYNASFLSRQPMSIGIIPNSEDPNDPYDLEGWMINKQQEAEE